MTALGLTTGTMEARDSWGATIRDLRMEDYDALLRLWTEAGLPFRPQGRDGPGGWLPEGCYSLGRAVWRSSDLLPNGRLGRPTAVM